MGDGGDRGGFASGTTAAFTLRGISHGGLSRRADRFVLSPRVGSSSLSPSMEECSSSPGTSLRCPEPPFLLLPLAARREQALLEGFCGRGTYHTVAQCWGREREISIDLGAKEGGRDAGMSVAVDGEQVFHVRCLQWKFRGSEKLEIEAGAGMQVSWDLHAGLFHSKASASSHAAGWVRAVFLFRFKNDESLISLGKDLDFDED